jgi:hypothetical protein
MSLFWGGVRLASRVRSLATALHRSTDSREDTPAAKLDLHFRRITPPLP